MRETRTGEGEAFAYKLLANGFAACTDPARLGAICAGLVPVLVEKLLRN